MRDKKGRFIKGATSLRKTHGMSETRFYTIWTFINIRCKNSNCVPYERYGGRGIKCLWETFEKFRDDMYQPYLKHVAEFGENNTTIDRTDNNGDYRKENCRWATRKEQGRNKRNNILITFNGKTKCLTEWAEKIGIKEDTLWTRIRKYNWSTEKALTTPTRKHIS